MLFSKSLYLDSVMSHRQAKKQSVSSSFLLFQSSCVGMTVTHFFSWTKHLARFFSVANNVMHEKLFLEIFRSKEKESQEISVNAVSVRGKIFNLESMTVPRTRKLRIYLRKRRKFMTSCLRQWTRALKGLLRK